MKAIEMFIDHCFRACDCQLIPLYMQFWDTKLKHREIQMSSFMHSQVKMRRQCLQTWTNLKTEMVTTIAKWVGTSRQIAFHKVCPLFFKVFQKKEKKSSILSLMLVEADGHDGTQSYTPP